MKTKSFILKLARLLVCGFLFLQIGCVAAVIGGAAVGAGTVIYVKGQLEESMNASTTTVYKATLAAFQELNMPITGDAHDGMSVELKSYFADGKTVWIAITSITPVSSKVTIRVGTFGDEYRSQSVLTTIHKHLPTQ
jgi:hypothetical protein